jgi:hypothetical protein
MAKKPRSTKNKDKNPATVSLLAALKFIEPASREFGQVNQTHCALGGNWVVAFDGVLCIADKIDTDIVAYPNTKKLIAALANCDETTQITQLDNDQLAIKSGKFKAFIPCVDAALIGLTPPDPAQYPIDDRVRTSLEIVGKLAKENAPRMVAASVLLRNGSAVATDGNLLVEHWHGWQLPDVILPKRLVIELANTKKKLTHFGASANTATFWFEDGSFMRSQLYTEKYPDVSRVTDTKNTQQPIPENLFAALDKIEILKDENKIVYFTAEGLQTHMGDMGASYEMNGVPPGIAFNIDYLRLIGPYVKSVDWKVQHNMGSMAIFQGENFRAFLMQMHIRQAEPDPPNDNDYRNPHADDIIPF